DGVCHKCEICNVMHGVGGAGTFSDGTLNLRPDIGGDLRALTKSEEKAWDLVKYVDDIWVEYGAPPITEKPDHEVVEALMRRAAENDVRFIDITQRHIGSDYSQLLIDAFEKDLRERGIEFLLKTVVEDIIVEGRKCVGVRLAGGKEIAAKAVLLAIGRVGANWLDDLVVRHAVNGHFAPVDIGVRVEVPNIIMDPITAVNRDPKFHIRSNTYDDFVRTFCANRKGFVVAEQYKEFVGVNGHSMRDNVSPNTNFALLVRIALTEPVENTTDYATSVAKLATTIGGGKPLVQRLGDLKRGQRTTWSRLGRNHVVPTLTDVTPGDISMALPHRLVVDVLEALKKLSGVIPGVDSDSTLLYAPELKLYAMALDVDRRLMTNIPGLFAAGDGPGLSRDLVNAAATGVLAGRGIPKWLDRA
ncbi:MAG: NAD(P)/FAD-dependent oxidoreductase, partial [Thermoplasmata archaeon]|nr:NAD(P)/FAD-dependent oxidoreductase [Thermoplasmata archaeon]